MLHTLQRTPCSTMLTCARHCFNVYVCASSMTSAPLTVCAPTTLLYSASPADVCSICCGFPSAFAVVAPGDAPFSRCACRHLLFGLCRLLRVPCLLMSGVCDFDIYYVVGVVISYWGWHVRPDLISLRIALFLRYRCRHQLLGAGKSAQT